MDSNCQNGQNWIKAIRGIFSLKKRQKTLKIKVKKIISVGSVLVSMKNIMTNVLVVVIVAIYFAEVLAEVLVKMTNGKLEKGAKKQFLGVYMTSEKTRRKFFRLQSIAV